VRHRKWVDRLSVLLLAGLFWSGSFTQAGEPLRKNQEASVKNAERHLMNVRQLTFGRQNAEAYFSFSGDKLIFQSTNNWMKDSFAATLKPDDAGLGCYQMYVMDLESNTIRLVSTGTGRQRAAIFSPAIVGCCTRLRI